MCNASCYRFKYGDKRRDLTTGLPQTVKIYSSQVEEAIRESIEKIVEIIKQTLERTPPELSSDIMVKGIVLSGEEL